MFRRGTELIPRQQTTVGGMDAFPRPFRSRFSRPRACAKRLAARPFAPLSPMTITLTENQLEAAQDYLDSLDDNTRRRGDKYFLENRVGPLDPYKRGIGFRTNVTRGQAH